MGLSFKNKNFTMIILSLMVMIINATVLIVHRYTELFTDYLRLNNLTGVPQHMVFYQNLLFIFPFCLFVGAFILYKKNQEHPYIPLLIVLCLTFGSISIIAAGDGLVEYHFSIFMVLAMIAYYEKITFTLISTVIFALHHFLGFFFFQELLCGTDQYRFSLLLIHAIFLVCSSAASMLQIHMSQKYTRKLQEMNQEKEGMLTRLIAEMQQVSQKVVQTVKELNQGTLESTKASQHITESLQEMVTGIEAQNQQTIHNKQLLDEMTRGIRQIAENSAVVAQNSNHATKDAKQGTQYLEDAVKQMNQISTTVQHIAQVIHKLEQKSNEINSIISVINEIADQTNLLSLNAAIEAARAGEAGKGFAVVAGEVRKLASHSSLSASKISALIQEIQKDTKEAVAVISIETENVDQGVRTFVQLRDIFGNLYHAAENVEQQILNVSSVSKQLASASIQVVESIDQAAASLSQSASSSENISAAAEQQLASIEDVKLIAQKLEDLSVHLNKQIEQIQS